MGLDWKEAAGIATFGGSNILLGTGAALGGLGLDLYSAQQQRKFNAEEAAKQRRWSSAEAQLNRDFQAEQSATAMQRAARDAEAAGLNRVLALGNPASSPSGSMPSGSAASISNPQIGKGSIASMISVATALQQMQQTEAQTRLLTEQSRLTGAEADVQEVFKKWADVFGPDVQKLFENLRGGAAKGDIPEIIKGAVSSGAGALQTKPAPPNLTREGQKGKSPEQVRKETAEVMKDMTPGEKVKFMWDMLLERFK